jgi:hypothetical protein
MQVVYLGKSVLNKENFLKTMLPYLTFFFVKLLVESFIPIKSVSYLDAYKDVDWLITIKNNLYYYLNVWGELFKDARVLQFVNGFALICLFLSGIGISVEWKNNILYITFIILYLGLLLLTPFYQGMRYLIPLVPVLFYFAVSGIFYLVNSLYHRFSRFIAFTFVGFLITCSYAGTVNLTTQYSETPYMMDGPYLKSAIEMFDFIKKNTPKGSIVGYWKPRIMLLYGGRNGIVNQTYSDCIKRKTNYYVYYRNAYADQLPIDTLNAHSQSLKLVFANVDFKIFKITSNDLVADDANKYPNSEREIVKTIDYRDFSNSFSEGTEKFVGIWSNDTIKAKPFNLSKGNYILSIYSKGTKAAGQFPLNSIILNGKKLGQFYSRNEIENNELYLKLAETTEVELQLKLENDLNENGEDRNTLIQQINIYKVP